MQSVRYSPPSLVRKGAAVHGPAGSSWAVQPAEPDGRKGERIGNQFREHDHGDPQPQHHGAGYHDPLEVVTAMNREDGLFQLHPKAVILAMGLPGAAPGWR